MIGAETRYRYNGVGAVIEASDALSQVTSYNYTPRGQLRQITDPNGNSRSWVYDPATDWPLAATDPLGAVPGDPAHSTLLQRDRHGRVIKETDPAADVVEYGYLRNGRLSTITSRGGTALLVTQFYYDAQGRVTSIKDPAGAVSTFDYDEIGRLFKAKRPGAGAQWFLFDLAGRLVEFRDRNGAATTYAYDAMGRVTKVNEPNWPVPGGQNAGKTVTFTYDRIGRRLSMTDDQLPNAFRYAYDAAGRITARVDPWGHRLMHSYNQRGDLIRVSDSTGNLDLRYERDPLGRVSRVTDSSHFDASETFEYHYSDGVSNNRLYRLKASSVKVEHSFQYDAKDSVIGVTHRHNTSILSQYGYVLRSDDLISQFTGDRIGALAYDGAKQIVSEGDVGVRSAYDLAGNRLWRAGAVPANFQTFDAAYRLVDSPQLGEAFTYDANGSLLRRQDQATGSGTNFVYDGADRLVRVETSADIIEYLYDPDGALIERKRSGAGAGSSEVRRYRYIGRNMIAQVDDAGALIDLYTIDPDGRRLRRRSAASVPGAAGSHSVYYLYDGMDDVVGLVDASGVERVRIGYDIWGNETLNDPDRLADVFSYRGAYRDPVTGLIHFGLRWYAPDLGRWMSEDPLLPALIFKGGGQLEQAFEELSNLYRYVGNDPANRTDPFGLGKGKIVIRVIRWIRGGAGRGRLGRPGAAVSEAQAARIVEEGGHVQVSGAARARQQTARKIAEAASERGRAVHDAPHGPGQRPHYHPVERSGGHVLYSATALLTAEHYLGDNWFSTAVDFFNPLSLPNDIVGIGLELAGDD